MKAENVSEEAARLGRAYRKERDAGARASRCTIAGRLHVNDSAHEHHAADPGFDVPALWIATLRNESGDPVASAEGETAYEAIANARALAEAWNAQGA